MPGPGVAGPLVRFALAGLLALTLVGVAAVVLQHRAAHEDAIKDAELLARVGGGGIVQPNLTPALLAGRPAAIARLDRAVRNNIRHLDGIARIKVWTADGRIVYSDLQSLIGMRFTLPEEDREALVRGRAKAELTTLDRAENRVDGLHGRLLEVYQPMKATNGEAVLFELYQRESAFADDAKRTWLAFAPALVAALLVLQLLQLPLARRMARSLEAHGRERERLLLRAVAAADSERRRIAADIHDGVVQDLAGTSYSLAAAANGAEAQAGGDAADVLRDSASQTRRAIRQLRGLLVDIYPPDLRRAGLPSVLFDLVASVEARGMQTTLALPDRPVGLPGNVELLLFRTAQEALRNALSHSHAASVELSLTVENDAARLTITDDGHGFRPDDVMTTPVPGHLGLRVLADMALDAGGRLTIESHPGRGARLCLEVPLTAQRP